MKIHKKQPSNGNYGQWFSAITELLTEGLTLWPIYRGKL